MSESLKCTQAIDEKVTQYILTFTIKGYLESHAAKNVSLKIFVTVIPIEGLASGAQRICNVMGRAQIKNLYFMSYQKKKDWPGPSCQSLFGMKMTNFLKVGFCGTRLTLWS